MKRFNIVDFLFYKYYRVVFIFHNPMAIEAATFLVLCLLFLPLIVLFFLLRYKYQVITLDIPDLVVVLFPVIPFFVLSNYFEKRLKDILKSYDSRMKTITNIVTDVLAVLLFILVITIPFYIGKR